MFINIILWFNYLLYYDLIYILIFNIFKYMNNYSDILIFNFLYKILKYYLNVLLIYIFNSYFLFSFPVNLKCVLYYNFINILIFIYLYNITNLLYNYLYILYNIFM